jgi:hypothetical protein
MRISFISTALLTIALSVASTSVCQSSTASGQWLLSYQGKNSSDVRWDRRFLPMLKGGLPQLPDKTTRGMFLPATARLYLSGPPNPVNIQSNRFVTIWACVPGVCEEKGLLWVDVAQATPRLLFAELDCDALNGATATLSVFTKDGQLRSKLPPQFIMALKTWIAAVGVKKLTSFTIQSKEQDRVDLPIGHLGIDTP